MQVTPSIAQAIFSIVASVLLVVAGYYLKKIAKDVFQRYQDGKNKDALTKARQDAQAANQKANAESDKLRDIDGR